MVEEFLLLTLSLILAHIYGLNPEDEIIAIDGKRVDSKNFDQLKNSLQESSTYEVMISRLGEIKTISILQEKPFQELVRLRFWIKHLSINFLNKQLIVYIHLF